MYSVFQIFREPSGLIMFVCSVFILIIGAQFIYSYSQHIWNNDVIYYSGILFTAISLLIIIVYFGVIGYDHIKYRINNNKVFDRINVEHISYGTAGAA